MDYNQKTFYSNDEIELIKATFGKDKQQLFQLRNLLWQFEDKIPEFSEEVIKILRKVITPECNKDVPIFQQRDLYSPLFYIKESNPEVALLHIEANDILIQYVLQQFDELVGIPADENARIVLKDLPSTLSCDQEKQRFVNVLAYHKINQYLDSRINELQILANPPKEETEDEKKERLKKDSSK